MVPIAWTSTMKKVHIPHASAMTSVQDIAWFAVVATEEWRDGEPGTTEREK
jgi:hypothetical protein